MYLDGREPADVADELQGGRRMKILYVCHRFPFPPKRGGKIRPFNMIRHLSRGPRGDGRARSRARRRKREEGAGIAAHLRSVTRWRGAATPVQALRMVARLPTPHAVVDGLLLFAARSRGACASCSRGERFDLIFVHCSSVAQYVERRARRPEDPRLRRHGFAEVARVRALQAVSAVARLLARRRASSSARSGGSRARFDLCTATTRAEWETLDGYGTGAATDWFPERRRQRLLRADRRAPTTPTRSLRRAHGLLPEPGVHVRFLRERAAAAAGAPAGDRSSLIVGADPSPAVRALGELPGVTVTGSVPDVRPYLRRSALMVAPLNIARGTQNKILEAMAMGVPVVTSAAAAGGVDASPTEHFLVADDRRVRRGRPARCSSDPAERARLPAAGRGGCSRTTRGSVDAAARRHHRALRDDASMPRDCDAHRDDAAAFSRRAVRRAAELELTDRAIR